MHLLIENLQPGVGITRSWPGRKGCSQLLLWFEESVQRRMEHSLQCEDLRGETVHHDSRRWVGSYGSCFPQWSCAWMAWRVGKLGWTSFKCRGEGVAWKIAGPHHTHKGGNERVIKKWAERPSLGTTPFESAVSFTHCICWFSIGWADGTESACKFKFKSGKGRHSNFTCVHEKCEVAYWW